MAFFLESCNEIVETVDQAVSVKIYALRQACRSEILSVYDEDDQRNALLGVSWAPTIQDVCSVIEAHGARFHAMRDDVIAIAGDDLKTDEEKIAAIDAIVWNGGENGA